MLQRTHKKHDIQERMNFYISTSSNQRANQKYLPRKICFGVSTSNSSSYVLYSANEGESCHLEGTYLQESDSNTHFGEAQYLFCGCDCNLKNRILQPEEQKEKLLYAFCEAFVKSRQLQLCPSSFKLSTLQYQKVFCTIP